MCNNIIPVNHKQLNDFTLWFTGSWKSGCNCSCYGMGLDIVDHCYMNMFQSYSSFSHKNDGEPPQDMRDLIKLLLCLIQVSFQRCPPTPNLNYCICHSTVDPLSFFLCFYRCHGDARNRAVENLIAV